MYIKRTLSNYPPITPQNKKVSLFRIQVHVFSPAMIAMTTPYWRLSMIHKKVTTITLVSSGPNSPISLESMVVSGAIWKSQTVTKATYSCK